VPFFKEKNYHNICKKKILNGRNPYPSTVPKKIIIDEPALYRMYRTGTYRVELGKGSGFPDLEVAPRCGQVTRLHSLTSASMKKNYKQIFLNKKITSIYMISR
jgi:hypothetical protein